MSSIKAIVSATTVMFIFATQLLAFTAAAAGAELKIIVPDPDNLQFMSFWVAKGAGYFADEGITPKLLVPDAPPQAQQMVLSGEADCAVLPPPMYLELIAERFPWALVANLLENDAINLIVRRSVAEERHLDPAAPLKDRLAALSGLRIGVAPNPPSRLRALFDSVGLDADRDIKMVILRGKEQNAAFAEKRVDALYAHTPYLETALVDQDAVMFVNQSKGEVARLAVRQIHALVVSRRLIKEQSKTVQSLVHAIARAEQLIHRDKAAAVRAILNEFPEMQPRHVERAVTIYEPAIPLSPHVGAQGIPAALELFPASRQPPDLKGIDLAEFVAPEFAEIEASRATKESSQ